MVNNLAGESPLWGFIVTNHQLMARVSVARWNLKEEGSAMRLFNAEKRNITEWFKNKFSLVIGDSDCS
jgi:hypothetical protein